MEYHLNRTGQEIRDLTGKGIMLVYRVRRITDDRFLGESNPLAPQDPHGKIFWSLDAAISRLQVNMASGPDALEMYLDLDNYEIIEYKLKRNAVYIPKKLLKKRKSSED